MTLADAQNKYALLVQRIAPDLSSKALLQIQRDLVGMSLALPPGPEYDLIRAAIDELQPQLVGSVTAAVVADLQSRTSALNVATALLSQTGTGLSVDARTLTFEQPKVIAAALTDAATTAQEIRKAASAGDYTLVLDKAQVLFTKARAAIGS